MIDPISTYRIQFNKDFTFKNLKAIIPYLHGLGIKTIYASPIYKSVPGSNHGYDVTDPNQINPEIGTLEELREISALLKSKEMYWLQDIVPNHMGFHQDNAWLMDVLQNGEQSAYRQHFDLITSNLEKEPIMVPFLGDDLDKVIERNELELIQNEDHYSIKYFDSLWPINNRYPNPEAVELKELIAHQYYRLCNYRETNSQINYRRFFTVNSLICLNMQLQQVFEDYHQLTKQLLDEGIFQGLRIDHVDGLADPTGYLQQLRELCGDDIYIVVEKILEPGEDLPKNWPIQGSTGYDYLGLSNQLFTCTNAKIDFERTYELFAGKQAAVEDQILEKKKAFLENHMQGELENLCKLTLTLLPNKDKLPDPLTVKELIASILVALPVYRLYTNGTDLATHQQDILNQLFSKLEKETRFKSFIPDLKAMLLATELKDERGISYFNRLMQFTGPLMAKGVEDTLMYTYHRFIGNNEVGDSPVHFGIEVQQFHQAISDRAKRWPLAMNASATHDTKRSEDSRTRLSALTEFASEWTESIVHWRTMNQALKTEQMPDENDEYFIYQTLIASCPEQGPNHNHYQDRLFAYIEKALRESKRRSNWDEPDAAYEKATQQFVSKLLKPQGGFWHSFHQFLLKFIKIGKLNSLSSLVLKHTLPGIPDTYQGTEFFDLSMVDPDNRRAIDYHARHKSLQNLKNRPLSSSLQSEVISDDAKLHLLKTLLQLRQQHRELFAKGDYHALGIGGNETSKIIAYARHYRQQWLLVVVPILNCNKSGSKEPFRQVNWTEIELSLPKQLVQAQLKVTNSLTGQIISNLETDQNGKISLEKLLDGLPVAIYQIEVLEKKRSSGVLMHLTSLPTAFGIGDLGPSADRFLDFLADAKMKYWQVLPMNPITSDQSFSPYSSTSAMAGNVLLISPEVLADWGLMSAEDLKNHQLKQEKKVNYKKAEQVKKALLKKAYQNWATRPSSISKGEFEAFCEAQKEWLNDYVLFVHISKLENGKPWYQWPTTLKQRQQKALNEMVTKHLSALEELKWQQFVFFKQWNSLKQKAAVLGIELIGDIPFYCAHNSADVWANPTLFAVDKNGAATGIAGVPPDYFNEDGQLWGMPVYNWKAMEKDNFDWWKKRMAMNLALYDKVRLDHFRAFDEYWEVPAGSETAKTGSWKAGPGRAFFRELEKSLGKMPLIAEDLGEITTEVYQLRDDLELPGMKVLQFAFGEDMAQSVHIPHQYQNSNCIVYTGTHDNNTTRGWFEDDTDMATKARIESYLGSKVNHKTISQQLIRLALASTAANAIISIQDLLNLPSSERMNVPASVDGNWTWRLEKEDFYEDLAKELYLLIKLYDR
ncbi:malto-oligosyltrehalose synthase [Pedobacter xixiisoli]|uniref:4-alpha-glucanotransferase n=1 Tax=Pedobacter xixiisoli TaxID=1476464 RepID=A0A285ZWR6_9SPHI|nr:malto-oligosyltrehalose synthase [Pedobacter xixiisoli]SOD14094.1 4-alpha-glucanotransferase/malto-oligosyltrehalose synthase,TIGR02401 [Pedobacter xixiisoli]